MTKDILLNSTTHDLDITNYDFALSEQDVFIRQSVKIRLQFFRGEWFLNTITGLPFFEDILVKNPNINHIDNIIKAEIIDTAGVDKLLEYESEFDSSLRELSVSFKVDTDYGEIEMEETVP